MFTTQYKQAEVLKRTQCAVDGLRRYKHDHGLTSVALAENLNAVGFMCHNRTVDNWRLGRSSPSMETVFGIEVALALLQAPPSRAKTIIQSLGMNGD